MTCLIGIDVGGTKIAAGLVTLPAGEVLARRLQPTLPERGGEAVLADVIALARSLQDDSIRLNTPACGIGFGVAELVSPAGVILDQATIRWVDLPVSARIESQTSLPATIEADVRAAARGEAELGAGRGLPSFLYVTVGTGISACLILDGSPYSGARGLAGSFASSRTLIAADSGELVAGPPLERFAGGPALASRLAALLPKFTGAAADVLALAAAGDDAAISVVDSASGALGAAIAHLVNVLDPQAIVIGGGLGLAGGRYRSSLERALRSHIYSDHHRDVPLFDAVLGADAGWIGAALAAYRSLKGNHER
ncbi:MAG: ROK family protein [Pirellulales bacterium]